jgi:exosortase A-associated hydrolase 2
LIRLRGQFISTPRGRVFTVVREPSETGQSAQAALLVPPFAEEMNKSRSTFTDVAQALASKGIVSLLPDLTGTGDSDGRFDQADWEHWCDDLEAVYDWARSRSLHVRYIVAVRLGCLLAASWNRRTKHLLERTLFCQPVLSGEQSLSQFLRIRVAWSLVQGRRESISDLKARLKAGHEVDVAGYRLGPALAQSMAGKDLVEEVASSLGRITWLEIDRELNSCPSTGSRRVIEELARSGVTIEPKQGQGEPFWMTTENVRSPPLVRAASDLVS